MNVGGWILQIISNFALFLQCHGTFHIFYVLKRMNNAYTVMQEILQ